MEFDTAYNRWKVDAIQFDFGSPGSLVVPGTSKFGGSPDLPEDFTWPVFAPPGQKAHPLTFLVQIDCEQIFALDVDGLLPRTGRLYFFYDTQSQPDGCDPAHRGSCYVYYDHSDPSTLIPFPAPDDLPDQCIFPAIPLHFESTPNLPGEELLPLYMGEDFVQRYHGKKLIDLRASLGITPARLCKLLGYPDAIQGNMLTQCEQIAGRGLSPKDTLHDLTPEQQKQLQEDAMDWMLLFQLDSLCVNSRHCKNFSLSFGRDGRLFIYIRRQDLALQRFDRCWCILQDT